MARKNRKTVQLCEIVKIVNRRNRASTCNADIRQGWNALLEEILHNAGNYQGYGYYTDANNTADSLESEKRRMYYHPHGCKCTK